MKIVFVDVDGVLNFGRRVTRNTKGFVLKDWVLKHPIQHLNRITRTTGAKLVISSTWRIGKSLEELQEMFAGVGVLGEVIGKTESGPCEWHIKLGYHECSAGHRGAEINEWLRRNGPVESFVILDDDSDMAHLAHRHVKTGWYRGMIRKDCERAIQLLTE